MSICCSLDKGKVSLANRALKLVIFCYGRTCERLNLPCNGTDNALHAVKSTRADSRKAVVVAAPRRHAEWHFFFLVRWVRPPHPTTTFNRILQIITPKFRSYGSGTRGSSFGTWPDVSVFLVTEFSPLRREFFESPKTFTILFFNLLVMVEVQIKFMFQDDKYSICFPFNMTASSPQANQKRK